jgi:galacturan 1,4-alpha-galacturonidase
MFFKPDTVALAISLLSTTVYSSPTPALNDITPVLAKRATCTPASAGSSGTDDVPAITAAIKSCGNGGTIVFPAGVQYSIRSTLDFTGCTGCTFNIEGTLKVSDDLNYWEGKRAIFYMNGIKTATIQSVTGTGVIDGNGQAAYDYFAQNSSYARPTLHYIAGSSSGITIQNLQVKNPPNVFFSVTGSSTNVIYSGLTMTAKSKSDYAPKNTDGFDVGASTHVTLKNIVVSNQDDCIAFKPGANYVTVNGISCTGSHGISVGSLGGGAGSTDTVKNVYVSGATMINSTKAVGIKLYPAGSAHGTAVVSNVTFDGVTVKNCDWAAQIQSCYGEDTSYCSSYPSTASVTGVYFKNFKGTTSSKNSPNVANLDCPSAGTCDINFSNWAVAPTSGSAKFLCANVDSSTGLTCTAGASG